MGPCITFTLITIYMEEKRFFAKGDGLVIWYIKEGKLVGRSQMHLSLVSVREEESVCHILTRLDWGNLPLPELQTFSGFLKLVILILLKNVSFCVLFV